MKAHSTHASRRGTSLVEALVALAVMAFGMLAVVGIQTTLRSNADVAKQRYEGVRIAQEAMETARAFSAIANNAGPAAYARIVARDEAVDGSNTSFTLTQVVTPRTNPDRKEIRITVAWTDRNGLPQQVELNGIIGANDPLVSLALGAEPKGIPVRQPLGRHSTIPPQAVSLGGGSSAFRPAPTDPNRATRVLLLDDLTGVITSVCSFPVDGDFSQLVPAVNCEARPHYLISGFVRFSLADPPLDASAPTGTQIALGMRADGNGGYGDGRCYVDPVRDPPLTYTPYYCRVPMGADGKWTGSTFLALPLDLGLYDVCRYTNGEPGNANHPQVYLLLDRSLASQNFLVVKHGVACPDGTAVHQPPP